MIFLKRKLIAILTIFTLTYVISDAIYDEKEASAFVREENETVIVGGQTVGIKLYSDGIMCIEFENGEKSPAYMAGLRQGDIILSANGMDVNSTDDFASIIENSVGSIKVVFDRNGKETEAEILPETDSLGKKRVGVWVRDSVGGVGTLTCQRPEKGEIIALGHSVSDADTGISFPVQKGYITDCEVVLIEKSSEGKPGEICGRFPENENIIGYITDNRKEGIYGNDSGMGKISGVPAKIALKTEIKDGRAVLLTDLAGESVVPYEVSVKKIYGAYGGNMIVEIKDERLLKITGGIVQGMSGSPIMQNGKLIGALTHVFVNDPTKGYGIFIENMLSES